MIYKIIHANGRKWMAWWAENNDAQVVGSSHFLWKIFQILQNTIDFVINVGLWPKPHSQACLYTCNLREDVAVTLKTHLVCELQQIFDEAMQLIVFNVPIFILKNNISHHK